MEPQQDLREGGKKEARLNWLGEKKKKIPFGTNVPAIPAKDHKRKKKGSRSRSCQMKKSRTP